jgi:hypothetical protein
VVLIIYKFSLAWKKKKSGLTGRAYEQCGLIPLRTDAIFQMPTDVHPSVTLSRGNSTCAWLHWSDSMPASDR